MIKCSCGGGNGVNHPISENGCLRKIAVGNLIPSNFRTENGMKLCDVNGYTITEYTLLHQRMYAIQNGVWTLPKDEDSVNSIQMND